MKKIETANKVFKTFQKGGRIERRKGGIYVYWPDWRDKNNEISRRWQTMSGNDHYPVWHKKYPGGGTSSTALSQLIRWIQGRPVLPILSWRYWASDTIKLLPIDAVKDLLDGGYPEHVNCVLCGEQIKGGLDWWRLDKVSGPCCSYKSGCRQKAA